VRLAVHAQQSQFALGARRDAVIEQVPAVPRPVQRIHIHVGVEQQAFLSGARRGAHVQLAVAAAVGAVGDLGAVRRPGGIGVVGGRKGEAGAAAALQVDDPDVAPLASVVQAHGQAAPVGRKRGVGVVAGESDRAARLSGAAKPGQGDHRPGGLPLIHEHTVVRYRKVGQRGVGARAGSHPGEQRLRFPAQLGTARIQAMGDQHIASRVNEVSRRDIAGELGDQELGRPAVEPSHPGLQRAGAHRPEQEAVATRQEGSAHAFRPRRLQHAALLVGPEEHALLPQCQQSGAVRPPDEVGDLVAGDLGSGAQSRVDADQRLPGGHGERVALGRPRQGHAGDIQRRRFTRVDPMHPQVRLGAIASEGGEQDLLPVGRNQRKGGGEFLAGRRIDGEPYHRSGRRGR